MIYLLPFFTAFILYACFVQGQPLHIAHAFIMRNIEAAISFTENKIAENKNKIYLILNKILRLLFKAVGGCTMCFAGQIGLWTLVVIYLVKTKTGNACIDYSTYGVIKEIGTFIFLIAYNAVSAVFLFRQALSIPQQQPKVMTVPTKKNVE